MDCTKVFWRCDTVQKSLFRFFFKNNNLMSPKGLPFNFFYFATNWSLKNYPKVPLLQFLKLRGFLTLDIAPTLVVPSLLHVFEGCQHDDLSKLFRSVSCVSFSLLNSTLNKLVERFIKRWRQF